MISYFISIFIGIGAGYLYELGFFYNHALIKTTAPLFFIYKTILTFIRFIFLITFFWYVLHASLAHTILIIVAFFISFWGKILAKRI